MARPAGARNADYGDERRRLLAGVRTRLLGPGGARASFRELATAAGVSPATLRHYFHDREGVIAAMLEEAHRQGMPFLVEAAAAPTGDVATSLRWFFDRLLVGWTNGVGGLHGLGLSAGLGDGSLGPAYVNELLEPTLQALEARLARHMAAGQLAQADVRHAALMLLSPVVLALLHQDGLGGTRCRPLALGPFLDEHVLRFLRAYAPLPAGTPAPEPHPEPAPGPLAERRG